MLNFYCSNCWNDVSVWEYVLISIAQLLKLCQCVEQWAYVLISIVPTVEMMSVFEKMCSMSIVQLLKWCQFLRRCAWRLLSNCWNDVSVWGTSAQFLLSNCWNDVSVWEDVLNFYCVTVEMMSVCEKMCSMSIVQLLKLCQCLRRICSMSIVQLLKLCQCLRICANFYCPTVEMMSACREDVFEVLLSNCWNDVSVWEDFLDVYCPTIEIMSVFE